MKNVEIKRNTINKRLERGWCYERATKVIPLQRHPIGVRYYCTDLPLQFVNEMTPVGGMGSLYVKCLCHCGTFFDAQLRDLFPTVNCGCVKSGYTPSKLRLLADMENDADFAKRCKDQKIKSTISAYRLYLAQKAKSGEPSCNDFEPEPDTSYPLCKGTKYPYCVHCCISATMEEDYCE